jgi:exosortase/archaeosortase family protein
VRLSLITSPRLLLLAMAAAVWPVWRWYALRTFDGSDEPYGLIALATLVVVLVRNGLELSRSEKRIVCAAILLSIYVLLFRVLSPLPRALVAVAALATLVLNRRNLVANAALLGLSLPVVATLQFYLGYPLRVMAAEASILVLRALDFAVTREGTLLHWRGESIMVDAPCGGVRMLWFGIYLAAALAGFSQLGNRQSLFALAAALFLVIGANMMRATALFFKEAHIVAVPEWTHTGVGVVLFAGAILIIVRLTTGRTSWQPAT